jgi:hypothetical protein
MHVFTTPERERERYHNNTSYILNDCFNVTLALATVPKPSINLVKAFHSNGFQLQYLLNERFNDYHHSELKGYHLCLRRQNDSASHGLTVGLTN